MIVTTLTKFIFQLLSLSFNSTFNNELNYAFLSLRSLNNYI